MVIHFDINTNSTKVNHFMSKIFFIFVGPVFTNEILFQSCQVVFQYNSSTCDDLIANHDSNGTKVSFSSSILHLK